MAKARARLLLRQSHSHLSLSLSLTDGRDRRKKKHDRVRVRFFDNFAKSEFHLSTRKHTSAGGRRIRKRRWLSALAAVKIPAWINRIYVCMYVERDAKAWCVRTANDKFPRRVFKVGSCGYSTNASALSSAFTDLCGRSCICESV